MYISKTCNTVINHTYGDGFNRVEHTMLNTDDFVICRVNMVGEMWKGTHATVINATTNPQMSPTSHGRIVLDMQLPRQGTQLIRTLIRMCKGRVIVFANPPHDIQAMSSALVLLSHAKSSALRQVTFNMYQHQRWSK